MKHFIRFGSHQENKILTEQSIKKNVSGLAFNANIIAHTPAAIHKFININFPHSEFFIDPQTYIFQLDPIKYYSSTDKESQKVLKKSVHTLVTEYGEPVESISNTLEPLLALTFSKHLEEFTKNVIEFQLNYLQEEYNKRGSEGFEDYDEDDSILRPTYVIPPYFYLTLEDFDQWLDLNKTAYNKANEIPKITEQKIVPQLVFEKHILLDDHKLDKIIDLYNSLDSNEIFLWIDDFNESEVSFEYLRAFKVFLKKLNKNVINLYGGHLSLLLCKENLLAGFCHGPGYGEHRSVKPVGGGIPNAKFYLPFTGIRENFQPAYSVLYQKNLLNGDNKNYYKEVCNCKKCHEILKDKPSVDAFYEFGQTEPSRKTGREIPTQRTLFNNNTHFLLKRFFDIKNLEINQEKDKFQDFIEWNKAYKEVSTKHLEKWLNLLNNNAK